MTSFQSPLNSRMLGMVGSPMSPRVQSAVTVIGSITFFLSSTTGLTFFNKWFLNVSALRFEFPFAIAACHQFLAFVYTVIFQKVFLESLAGPIAYKKKYFYLLCPIGILCAMDWGSSNFSLKTVPLSLYEMIKSTTPLFTLVISIILGLYPLAGLLIASIFMICLGTYFSVCGADGPGAIFYESFPVLGASVLLLGSFASGFKAVMSQFVMQKLIDPETGKSDVNGVTMVFYLAPTTATCLLLASLVNESERMTAYFRAASMSTMIWVIVELTLSALIAFAVTISAFILVRKTSGLAYSVVKIGQRVGIVGLAMLIFGDHVGLYNGTGFAISLIGIGLYNYYELVHKHKDTSEDDEEEKDVLMEEGKAGYGTTNIRT